MRYGLLAFVLIGVATLGGCTEGVLDPKGPIALAERQILLNALGIMLAIVIPVILATLGVAFWFRASNERARYRPTLTIQAASRCSSGRSRDDRVPGWRRGVGGLTRLEPAQTDRIHSEAAASPGRFARLKWLFIYPDEGVASVNYLAIPVGTPVSFELTSSGVMNSFFVPQLGSQIYTMAGMVTRLQLQADQSGSYRGMSAQYSGEGFADMYFNVEAVLPKNSRSG